MQSLKNMPRVISDSEKIACLQRDMVTLKQQIASMTSKNAEVSKENVTLKSSVQDLKDKMYSLELILATKADLQAARSLEDRHTSLRQNIEATFVSLKDEIKSILVSLQELENKCVRNTYKGLVNEEDSRLLKLAMDALRKESFSKLFDSLSDLRKEIAAQIMAIPVPKTPVERDEIQLMIADAFVPVMNNAKKAMDWASEAKMDLGLFKRKIEKQVTY